MLPTRGGSWPSYAVNNTGKAEINNTKITSVHGGLSSYGDGAVLTLNNCELDMSGIPGFTSHGLYTFNGGKIIVNGGVYKNNAADQNASGASVINGNVEINGGVFVGRIENYYGTPVIKGSTFSVDPKAAYLAPGYKVTEMGDWYVVSPDTGDDTTPPAVVAADTQELLNAALDAGVKNIELQAGTYTFPTAKLDADSVINCADGTVFEGNSKLNIDGATVVGATFDNPSGTAADQTINGTFKDCTFTGSNALRWCYAGETVVFENCVFSGDVYGVHFDGGANEVVFKNYTFSGFNAMGGAITKLTMEGCTFVSNGKSNYNGINLWGDSELTNCKFIFDGSVDYEWVDLCNSNQTCTFTGCVISNGTTERALTIADVGNGGTNNTITIN